MLFGVIKSIDCFLYKVTTMMGMKDSMIIPTYLYVSLLHRELRCLDRLAN